jgi:hypothetical protein
MFDAEDAMSLIDWKWVFISEGVMLGSDAGEGGSWMVKRRSTGVSGLGSRGVGADN